MFARIFAPDEFTGWHMAGVIGLFFGTIITVNLTLAYFALHSWTGLVVENSYIASQHFNENTLKKEEQARLGWQAEAAYQQGEFTLTLQDKAGKPIPRADVMAMIGRPATEVQDRNLVLLPKGSNSYAASTNLGLGIWHADLSVIAADGKQWDQTIRFKVTDKN